MKRKVFKLSGGELSYGKVLSCNNTLHFNTYNTYEPGHLMKVKQFKSQETQSSFIKTKQEDFLKFVYF